MILNKQPLFLKDSITSEIHDLDGVLVYMIEPGIMVSQYYSDVELDIELALQIDQIGSQLGNGKAIPQLFLACVGQTVTKEVRDWSASPEGVKHTLCTAVACSSMAHKILGSFFIKVQKPPRPTKMFNDVFSAKEWLISQIQ